MKDCIYKIPDCYCLDKACEITEEYDGENDEGESLDQTMYRLWESDSD